MIWIHYLDFTQNHEDYSVTDWSAAAIEAEHLVRAGLSFVVHEEDRIKLSEMLSLGNWEEAVSVYNKVNAVGEWIEMREE